MGGMLAGFCLWGVFEVCCLSQECEALATNVAL